MRYQHFLMDYLSGSRLLEDKIKGLPNEVLLFKSSDGSWSIKDHVIHVVDSEINNFVRWRSILAQPKSRGFVIDQDAWTKNLKYETEDMNLYLSVLRLLRQITYNYLSKVEESEWDKDYYIHEYLGNVTLHRCIEIYTEHVYDHLNCIDKIMEEYKRTLT